MGLRRPLAGGSRSTVLLVLESDSALLDLLTEIAKDFGYTFNVHKKGSLNKVQLADQWCKKRSSRITHSRQLNHKINRR